MKCGVGTFIRPAELLTKKYEVEPQTLGYPSSQNISYAGFVFLGVLECNKNLRRCLDTI